MEHEWLKVISETKDKTALLLMGNLKGDLNMLSRCKEFVIFSVQLFTAIMYVLDAENPENGVKNVNDFKRMLKLAQDKLYMFYTYELGMSNKNLAKKIVKIVEKEFINFLNNGPFKVK